MQTSWVRESLVCGIIVSMVGASVVSAFNGNPYIGSKPSDGPIAEWNITWGGVSDDSAYSVQKTSDGGYITTGKTLSFGAGDFDVFLLKVDSNGVEQWNKTFGWTNMDEAWAVQQTTDGGYIIIGNTFLTSVGPAGVLLIKTDGNGTKQWDKIWWRGSWDTAECGEQTIDGGYIIAGWTNWNSAGGGDVLLLKTDANGNEQWFRTFGGPADNEQARSVHQTADGGYIIVGFTNGFGAGNLDMWLIKTDITGSLQWSKTFGGINEELALSGQQTADGGYIITGYTKTFGAGEGDVWLIKTDTNGNELWNKTFGGLLNDEGYSVRQTLDGGYIITGYTESYGKGSSDVWLIKTDTMGDEQWNETLGGPNEDLGWSVTQSTDKGYLIAGYTKSYGAGEKDIWLIKIKSENKPPIANFTYIVNELSVTFNASSSYDPDGNISKWLWEFGDGVKGTGEIVNHKYLSSGTYKVTLSIIDDDGDKDSITQGITVEKLQRAFIFGKITNLSSKGDYITFEAVKTRVITFSPLSFNTYVSGEKFAISKGHQGFIGVQYIFVRCLILI